MPQQLPPWHLWGSVQSVSVESDIVHFSTTQQLAQIRYARPESWRFYFKVAVLNIQGSAVGSTMTTDFNLSIGVGRATTLIKPFARFIFTPAELSALTVKQITSVELLGESAARTSPNIIEVFPAQTIQVDTVTTFDVLGLILPGSKIECTAFFAPNVHVRPEWHLRGGSAMEQFSGDEHKGR